MRNPYEILGVSRNATEDEINAAYRQLVKKYHPDKYVGNPLADLAKEKIAEINAAYDEIMDKTKKGSAGTGFDYDEDEILMLINQNRLSEAEKKLNQITVRDARWHFLMGSLLKKRGWYDMAYQHLDRAARLEPDNPQYREARDNMDFSGNVYRGMGNAGGYQVDCCDTCQALMCADCCCEMCGGNFLPCIGCR